MVFFDYELSKQEQAYDEFCAALSAEKEFASRIIVGDANSNVHRIESEFNNS